LRPERAGLHLGVLSVLRWLGKSSPAPSPPFLHFFFSQTAQSHESIFLRFVFPAFVPLFMPFSYWSSADAPPCTSGSLLKRQRFLRSCLLNLVRVSFPFSFFRPVYPPSPGSPQLTLPQVFLFKLKSGGRGSRVCRFFVENRLPAVTESPQPPPLSSGFVYSHLAREERFALAYLLSSFPVPHPCLTLFLRVLVKTLFSPTGLPGKRFSS